MKLIFYSIRYIIKLVSKIHNKYYYTFPNISNTVKFCTEYPGFVYILQPQNTNIGEHTIINKDTHINAGNSLVSIGRYCHFGQNLKIYAFNHRFENATRIPYDNVTIDKPVIIKDFVWIGCNVTITPGVTIEEGAVIGAGSVVTRNIEKGAIVGGNPAKVIKYRDLETFKKLKNEQKFF